MIYKIILILALAFMGDYLYNHTHIIYVQGAGMGMFKSYCVIPYKDPL